MSAIANPRPSSRLTRAERMAALSATRTAPAPLYKAGDPVTFNGRASRVSDVRRSSGGTIIYTVENYAGAWSICEGHSGLSAE